MFSSIPEKCGNAKYCSSIRLMASEALLIRPSFLNPSITRATTSTSFELNPIDFTPSKNLEDSS